LMAIGRCHNERAEPSHLAMQKPDGACFRIVCAEGIRADEFREIAALMNRSRHKRPHLMKDYADALTRDLPGSLGTGETGADDVNGIVFERWSGHAVL